MSQPYPISRETREEAIFLGSGVATYGPFDLKIFDAADLQVWTKLADATEWVKQTVTITKTANLAFDTFTITFPAIVAETTKIKVLSARVHERSAGLSKGTRLDMDALEKEVTKQGTILQELARDRDRAVKMDFDAGDGLIVQDGLEDGHALMKQGNYLVLGPSVSTINDAIAYRDQAAASAADALLSKIEASSSAAYAAERALYAAEIADTFNGQRTLPFTGAVNRTLLAVSQDNVVNAAEFAVAYNGTDQRTKMQAALDALQARGGGVLVIDGAVTLYGNLTVGNGVYIMGTGRRKARIIQMTANADTFVFGGTQSRLSGLTIIYNTQGTSGAAAMRFTGPVNCAEDFEVYYAAVGVRQIANDIRVSDYRIIDCTTAPILIGGAADGSTGATHGWYSDGVCYGDVATSKSALGNLRLQNNANSISFMNCKFLGGMFPITTDATTFSVGLCPAWCEFVNCHFDGARNTGNLNKIIGPSFTNCWLSGGREDAVDALVLNSCLGITFTNLRIVNCGMNGILVTPQCLSLNILGVQGFDCGSAPSATGVIAPIKFADGANGFVVQGAQGGNGWVAYDVWSGKQTHTVIVGAGCASFEVNAKNRGNLTGAVYQGTAASATTVYQNCF